MPGVKQTQINTTMTPFKSIRVHATLLFLTILLLIAAPLAAGQARLRPDSWAVPVISGHLQNWHKVDDRVYRSEQPDAAAMAELEHYGIRRVLSLRQFHDDKDEIDGTGLEGFRVPMNAAKIRDDDIVAALKIITASNEPILVHCWHGSDRTGVVVAMYRIVVQGWTREAALDELMHGGYGYHAVYGNIPTYIEQVDIESIRRQVGSSL